MARIPAIYFSLAMQVGRSTAKRQAVAPTGSEDMGVNNIEGKENESKLNTIYKERNVQGLR